jgi:HSP20 family molecular chaperone IbpA
MTLLKEWELDPFDLLWKNFFDTKPHYNTLIEKVNYPVDIYETKEGICFELAVVGLDKKDIDIQTEGDTLRISYRPDKNLIVQEHAYIYKGIARRAFDLAWKIANKYDLSTLQAGLDKGLLKIEIGYAISQQPKKVTIK